MECILYPEQCRVIFNVSFLTLGSCVYAIYNGHYDFAVCSGVVFFTSINYWRKPTYCWRRKLDMICVKLALIYHLYRAYRAQYMIEYYTIMFFALNFYPLGIYYHEKKLYWRATISHSGLHIFSNIGNYILYSGKVS